MSSARLRTAAADLAALVARSLPETRCVLLDLDTAAVAENLAACLVASFQG